MILTIDGQVVSLHPVIAAMVEVLIEKQEGVWRRRHGTVALHFAPHEVCMKVFDTPVFTSLRKTKEKRQERER